LVGWFFDPPHDYLLAKFDRPLFV